MRRSIFALAVLSMACSAKSSPSVDWSSHVAPAQLDAPASYAFLRHDVPEAFNPLHATWVRIDGGLRLGRALGALDVGVTAARLGRGDSLRAFPEVRSTKTSRNRVELERDGLLEWYVNGTAGLEQGFLLSERPEGDGPLAIELSVTGAAPFAHDGEITLGRYRVRGLAAYDADGRALPTTLHARDGKLRFTIDDRGARYPIDVDPLYVSAEVALAGTDSAASDLFGTSVAASGSVVVVGAPGHTYGGKTGAGAVYVFVRGSGGTWTQSKLVAADGVAGDGFGTAVAFNGSLLLVGAPGRTEAGVKSGKVYSYTGSGGTFTASTTFRASDAAAGDAFGTSLGLSANTAIVGAPQKNGLRGEAYVFERNTSTSAWAQQGALCTTGNGVAPSDRCGQGVAVSGNRALVGFPGKDDLSRNNFGYAEVYERSGTTWTFKTYLAFSGRTSGDFAGEAVALDVDRAMVGAPYRGGVGVVFAYTRGSTGTWTEQEIKLAAPVSGDRFGSSIALTGSLAIVGAPFRDDGARTNVGAANVYSYGTSWTLRDTLVPAAAIGDDRLGTSVAFAGEYWTLGGPVHDQGSVVDRGIAYTMEFSSTKANGASCAASKECTSGVCVDGFCCDRACGGCEACAASLKTAGADGVCGAAKVDTDPHNACAPDVGYPSNCKADGNCNGAGACRSFAKAGTACGATTCTAGTVTGRTCSGSAATCVDATASCGLYACGASACNTTCSSDAACAAGAYCTSASTCETKKTNGEACTATRECASGFCVDGVCCNAECIGQCESCNAGSTKGTCTPVSGTPPTSKTACVGAGTPCAGSCDGVNGATCAYPAAVECSASCVSGTQLLGACDGKGACVSGEPQKCGGFACDGDVRCRTTCSAPEHCQKGYVCVSGKCEAAVSRCTDDGTGVVDALGSTTSCAPLLCKGGVCLDTCNATTDCAPGFLCDSGKCTAPTTPTTPTDGGTDDSGGCTTTRRSTTGNAFALLLGAAALYGVRRRARRP